MNGESKTQKRTIYGYLLCFFCFGLTVWSFYPGFMSADSVGNMTNGREGVYYDINSPIVSWLWGKLDRIIEGPALMLVFQNLVFWTAAAVFWKSAAVKSYKLGFALILFGMLPHILPQLVCIWKDISLGVALFLAVALLYYAKSWQSRVALFLSPIPLFFGYAARLNALMAVLPIAIWSGFIVVSLFNIKKTKFIAVGIGVIYFVLLSFGGYFVTYNLTEGRTTFPHQQIYLYDLAAISAENNEMYFPEYIVEYENFSPELVKTRYNTRTINDLLYPNIPNPGDLPPLRITGKSEEVALLKEQWIKTVKANPLIYLKHKTKVFGTLIGLDRSISMTFFYEGFMHNLPEYRGNEQKLSYQILMKYIGAFRRPFPQTFFHRAFIWLSLCAYFLYRAVKNKLAGDWDIVFVLSLSCLLFTFAYLPTMPSTEFRYLFWSAISSAIVIIFGTYLSVQTQDNFIGKIFSRFGK